MARSVRTAKGAFLKGVSGSPMQTLEHDIPVLEKDSPNPKTASLYRRGAV